MKYYSESCTIAYYFCVSHALNKAESTFNKTISEKTKSKVFTLLFLNDKY